MTRAGRYRGVAVLALLPACLLIARRAASVPSLPASETCDAVAEVFRDDFSRFPPGWLSNPLLRNGLLNGAIQEYHYLPQRGVPLGPWANAIGYLDAWVAGDEDGAPYLEQHTQNTLAPLMTPLFVTGDPEWSGSVVEASVRPLSLAGPVGLAFRYHTNRHHYSFVLSGGKEARLRLRRPLETAFRVPDFRELARADFAYDSLRYLRLRVENDGPRMRAYVDGKLLLEASDGELVRGKAGVLADVPARFRDFRVAACAPEQQAALERIRLREAELARLRASNPRPRLWKRFDTPGFGAGRNVRFGDLDGDGQLDMLIAQNVPRVQGDAFDHISALTAVTLDGRVLWQSGRPNRQNALLTNDTPFQIHDLDGDGRNEVVLIRDFRLQVLDGRTGERRRAIDMPPMPESARVRPYELYSGDSIVFANLGGGEGRRDIVIKDRYRHFWAYSRTLEPLWQADDDTGHYPFPFDADGDGRDDVFMGHARYDARGQRIFSLDETLQDHVDALAVGNFTDDPKAAPRVYWSSSDEGFVMLDLSGRVLKQARVGHTQTAAIGKFRADVPGLQYVTTNFWKNPGIMSLFDAEGNLLLQAEPIHTGSVTLPVNWSGDGSELILLSGSALEGGMLDGHFRRVVRFPDDGHPELAAAALDLGLDPRDEIVLWDEDRVWIYTQDGKAPTGRVYAPRRNPTYNDSNYRANVSLPGWREPLP